MPSVQHGWRWRESTSNWLWGCRPSGDLSTALPVTNENLFNKITVYRGKFVFKQLQNKYFEAMYMFCILKLNCYIPTKLYTPPPQEYSSPLVLRKASVWTDLKSMLKSRVVFIRVRTLQNILATANEKCAFLIGQLQVEHPPFQERFLGFWCLNEHDPGDFLWDVFSSAASVLDWRNWMAVFDCSRLILTGTGSQTCIIYKRNYMYIWHVYIFFFLLHGF